MILLVLFPQFSHPYFFLCLSWCQECRKRSKLNQLKYIQKHTFIHTHRKSNRQIEMQTRKSHLNEEKKTRTTFNKWFKKQISKIDLISNTYWTKPYTHTQSRCLYRICTTDVRFIHDIVEEKTLTITIG